MKSAQCPHAKVHAALGTAAETEMACAVACCSVWPDPARARLWVVKAGERPNVLYTSASTVAVRVGALDGRHPEIEKQSLIKIAKALKKEGKLFIDGGNPLKEIKPGEYR